MKNKQGSLGRILSWIVVIFVGVMVYSEISKEVKEETFQLIKTNLFVQVIILISLIILVIALGYIFFCIQLPAVVDNLIKKKEEKKDVSRK